MEGVLKTRHSLLGLLVAITLYVKMVPLKSMALKSMALKLQMLVPHLQHLKLNV